MINSWFSGWGATLRRKEAPSGHCSCIVCLIKNRILGVGCYAFTVCTHPFWYRLIACWIEGSLELPSSIIVCLALNFKRKFIRILLFFVWFFFSSLCFLPLNSLDFEFLTVRKSSVMLPFYRHSAFSSACVQKPAGRVSAGRAALQEALVHLTISSAADFMSQTGCFISVAKCSTFCSLVYRSPF